MKYLLILLFVTAVFGYTAVTAELQYSFDDTYTGTGSIDWGPTLSSGYAGDPDMAVGYTHGTLQDHKYGALWFSKPRELPLGSGSYGVRCDVRKGLSYLADIEKAAIFTELQLGFYWLYLQLGVSYTCSIYVSETIRLPGTFRLTIALRKSISK